MSKELHDTSLAIVRSTHLARDAVLFSMFGFFFPLHWELGTTETLSVLIGLLDLVGLLFLWIPRETWQRVGCGWGVLMSIGLLFVVFSYFGNGNLAVALMAILLLCIIEAFAVFKISIDYLKADARSWTKDAQLT
jgi:hypothetical protein